ncbi:MAG: DNA replication and repair protein RecF [Verrucomicrobiales bacterium]|nr:DNA replication and repair protein RecF [Verrucomicrobiales bacterium]
MPLTSLRLRNFRCFASLNCPLPDGTALFIGDNAQGKTSVLEAICMLLRLHSPRTSRPAELVKFGGSEFGLGGTVSGRELRQDFANGVRTLSVDGAATAKTADYLAAGSLVVWMGNGDLELVTGASDARRRYLDFLGTQLFPEYRPAHAAYEKALRTRNFLLKRDAVPDWRQVDAYSTLLVQHGEILMRLRREMTAQIQPHAAAGHGRISGQAEELSLTYHTSAGEDFAAALRRMRESELRRRVTLTGPHRDELLLELNGRPAAPFASEGQQRTLALALKLAQATLLQTARGAAPLLLLDDIFGELDPLRRNALLSALPCGAQRLITTTHPGWVEEEFIPEAVFRVAEGVVQPL